MARGVVWTTSAHRPPAGYIDGYDRNCAAGEVFEDDVEWRSGVALEAEAEHCVHNYVVLP